MIQERTRPRFTIPIDTGITEYNQPTMKSSLAGLEQWIQQHPQVAFFGAVCLGASLGWLLKTRK